MSTRRALAGECLGSVTGTGRGYQERVREYVMYMGRKGWVALSVDRGSRRRCGVVMWDFHRGKQSWINDMRYGVRHESCREGTWLKVIDEREMKEMLGREEGTIA